MLRAILRLPFLVLMMGIGAAAMYVPSFFALRLRDYETARIFLYTGTFFLILTAMIGLATANGKPIRSARQHLAALASGFVLLPLILAVPLAEVVRDTTFLNAWFEMVSAFTTTGATVFDHPERLPDAVHLWRAMVGWMGGLLAWVAALAILAPLNLGGFEVMGGAPLRGEEQVASLGYSATPAQRLQRQAAEFLPIYTGLSLLLWIGLIATGLSPFMAACMAMATMSTSGILPVTLGGGTGEAMLPVGAEMLVLVFFVFAFTRRSFQPETPRYKLRSLWADRELRLAVVLVLAVSLALFLRHWIGAYEVARSDDLALGLAAFWGNLFTVASFLSTTGFVSESWAQAQSWSGLGTSGLALVGLVIFGGGVATTAGGIRLMRVLALYRHGMREMDRLVHPSMVAGSDTRIARSGTYIAWIFFMLFALSMAVVMIALALTGLDFETSATLSISALSTTGPLARVAAETPFSFSVLSDPAKVILAGAMVLGRLEVLALVALINPMQWRR